MADGNKPHRKRLLVLPLLLAVMIGAAVAYHLWSRGRITTDDAFVDGHIYPITPRISGYVVEVRVRDNELVQKDGVLLTLDRSELEVALASAQADLAQAEFTLASLLLGVPLELTQTASRVSGAEAEKESLAKNLERLRQEENMAQHAKNEAEIFMSQAQLDLQRVQGLVQSRVGAQSDLDQARTNAQACQAQVNLATAKLASVRQSRAALEADMKRLEANIELARSGKDVAKIKEIQVKAQKAVVDMLGSRVRQAELQLSYTSLRAPAEGFVSRRSVEPGQMVAAGQRLLAIVPLSSDRLWINANYKETQLTLVRPGLPAEIRIDTYPGVVLKGRVDSITSGTGAVFSLFPPENASGNYVKVVQRIPVKIVLEAQQTVPALRLGMSVVPTIFIGK